MSSTFEDLSGIYYIPAILTPYGQLKYDKRKLPWMPRVYLSPMVEPKISMGKKTDYDDFLSDSIGRLNKIKSWKEYLSFAIDFYELVTKSSFYDNEINGVELESQVYIIKDETINSVGGILDLYDDIEKKVEDNKLYENITSIEKRKKDDLIKNTKENIILHKGQMGHEYPLSDSQRECINHLNNMNVGEILAVNGPPGTGKTTLLQSVVADLFVKHAMDDIDPPLIVAASTNNQAVTNIISSFGLQKSGDSNIDERWINGAESLAVYFPSGAKKKEAEEKGYQFTNQKGENFYDELNSKDNIFSSKRKMLEESNRYFDSTFTRIEECKEENSKRMHQLEKLKVNILSFSEKIFANNIRILDIEDRIDLINNEIDSVQICISDYERRIQAWEDRYRSLPILLKLFKFIPSVNKKIIRKNITLRTQNEHDMDLDVSCLDSIIERYSKLIVEKRNNLSQKVKEKKFFVDLQSEYLFTTSRINDLKVDLNNEFTIEWCKCNDINEVNNLLDKSLRYILFWIAVHYYECKWLLNDDKISEKQKNSNFKNILDIRFKRLSMISPCYVMTFFHLPKVFKHYIGDGISSYLYEKIDLLIVDEAGQVSPEIAACSFALAKKAIVVGDVNQIEPVWSIERRLDMALAIENNVIESIVDFDILSENGLNTSESSLMKLSSSRCKYEKFGFDGLFLNEHRRCFDEIIAYCNDSVYGGHLLPYRGSGVGHKTNKYDVIPQIGYRYIETANSQFRGGSRYNVNEAEQICNWINEHFDSIKLSYEDEDEKNLIGIITPFKAQEVFLKKEIKRRLPSHIYKNIVCGTVHTFQGAERTIIIMSTVYGNKDGCSFLDMNRSMLNVAVSRAKNNFLVFGDINCLNKISDTASGLLYQYIKESSI
jgi:hypothetical protein